jgi:hypothetical protein
MMCNAFSCIVDRKKIVTWKFGTDSHDALLKIAGLKDNTIDPNLITFCRVEISPKNKDYMNPDKWVFKIDMDVTPTWWTLDHKKACMRAHEEWKDRLYKILVRKAIVHPFKITPPKKITKKHIDLLKEWASVRASVRASVGASVRASVGDSVGDSVWASVGDSVWASVRASVGDSVRASVGDSVRDSVGASVRASVGDSVWASVGASVWAYNGMFFLLPRESWKYTENVKTDEYPFLPLVKLWEQGLVPSFDGTKWRLHGGEKATILWEGEL